MNFTYYLQEQIQHHPSTEPRDILKQCYQAAFGAEHLLADLTRAWHYLEQEFHSTSADACQPLFEEISPQICRVNLAAWKAKGLPLAWLFRMFVASSRVSVDREQATCQFLSYLDQADSMIRDGCLSVSFSTKEWSDALSAYKSNGMTAVHHSDTYRQAEHPAYRIIRHEYVRLLPILEAAATYYETTEATTAFDQPCIIAMDGRAASGKTTMADELANLLDADVIRMDDFFLPMDLRSQERLSTPGGNVHYERFIEEVLPHLHQPEGFSYTRFDCQIMDNNGQRTLRSCASDRPSFRIVEGSYSHHPALRDYADIFVFSHVDPEKQMARILHRNGPQMAQMFESRWIPMEEAYFQTFLIQNNCHVIINTTDLF